MQEPESEQYCKNGAAAGGFWCVKAFCDEAGGWENLNSQAFSRVLGLDDDFETQG